MKTLCSLTVALCAATPLVAQERGKVTSACVSTDAKTGLRVVAASLELPPEVSWRLEDPAAGGPVAHVVCSGGPEKALYARRYEVDSRKWKPSGPYAVYGLLRGEPGTVELKFTGDVEGRACVVSWSAGEGEKVEDLVADWATVRAGRWLDTGLPARGSMTDWWLQGLPFIYKGAQPIPGRAALPGDLEPMDTFAVFGGRCAVTETLQMGDISETRRNGTPANRPAGPVPITQLPRLNVQSHPFAQMAGDAQLPAMPLASLCPPDRFFAFFPQPKRIRTVMDRLGDAAGNFSSPLTDGVADYGLWEKYLARLGLEEKVVRAWMEAGRAECVAFYLPDLFLRDASDVTFLIQMKDDGGPGLFKALPEGTGVLTLSNNGGQCHLARRGRVLIVSTSAGEAALALKLADEGGKGSLGASDELRCMRRKLPDSAATVAWCYFSDPFIRRLTGPEVKIGQHRRLMARESMEALTASALLYQLDHGNPAPDKETLLRSGYAFAMKTGGRRWERPEKATDEEAVARFRGINLAAGPLATSEIWGPLASLKPLGAVPVTEATPEEAAMYASYIERYEDYWRQYFDPIAIRLDETAPGTWSLGTFVLPLVHNSLYFGLKEVVDASRPAVLPALSPAPVALIGMATKREAMLKGGRELVPGLKLGGLGLTGRMALAFPDADPVLQLGGMGGVQRLGAIFGRRGMDEMGGIGLLVAMLTRPVDVFLEVENEAQALALLDTATHSMDGGFITIRSVLEEESGRRLYVLDLDGFAQVHFDVSITNGWMHLSNHPWSGVLKVTGTEPPERGLRRHPHRSRGSSDRERGGAVPGPECPAVDHAFRLRGAPPVDGSPGARQHGGPGAAGRGAGFFHEAPGGHFLHRAPAAHGPLHPEPKG